MTSTKTITFAAPAPQFRLSVGSYRSYVMSARDAATVMEILAKATPVSRSWIGDDQVLIASPIEEITLQLCEMPIITQAEADRRRTQIEAEQAAADQ